MKQSTAYKNSWYDGWFFANFVDPLSGAGFNRAVKKFIPECSSVIDIGCGPGSLLAGLTGHCSRLVGVDVSPRMIRYAKKHTLKNMLGAVELFLLEKGDTLSQFYRQFDYAVLKMVLHEIEESERSFLIDEVKKTARNIIITEWNKPPKSLKGTRQTFMEFAGGRVHFRNFKDWVARGALDGFLSRNNLAVTNERVFNDLTGKIVCVSVAK